MSLHAPKTNELFEDKFFRPLKIFGITALFIDVLESEGLKPVLHSYSAAQWKRKIKKEGIRIVRQFETDRKTLASGE